MKFDGFSTILSGESRAEKIDNFSLSFKITPFSYESCLSGVIYALDKDRKAGIEISVGKGGRIVALIGTGDEIISIETLTEKLLYQQENFISLGFWGEAGWVDLVVNGKLSMRKQFRRHASFLPKDGEYLVGKRKADDCRAGYFHGEIEDIRFEKEYIHYDSRIKEQAGTQRAPVKVEYYEGVSVKDDKYHVAFHFAPPAKWMNEPHGAFYRDGLYHIFYQANPHGPIWDNICWGHLISKDMVDWKYEGIALNPDTDKENDIDPDGCWSGSTCIDKSGIPVIFYTAGNNKYLPNQSVAIAKPKDLKDIKLTEWEKQGVIIRQPEDIGFLGEFRDPFAFIRNGKYFVLVGTGDRFNGGGNACVYSGDAIENLKFMGLLADYDYNLAPEGGHVWELPVLLPLINESGEKECDILLHCACQSETGSFDTYYFLGDFCEETGKFIMRHKIPKLLDLGKCIFTGPSGMVTEDGRSIVFSIAQGKRNPKDEFEAGWAHNGGMPVELSFKDGDVMIKPVRELDAYFDEVIYEGTGKAELSEVALLENRVSLTFEKDEFSFEINYGKDAFVVSYSKDTRRFEVTRKSDGTPFSMFRGEADEVLIENEPLMIDALFDHSLIEIYLNNRKSLSIRNYEYDHGYRIQIPSGEGQVTARIRRFAGFGE